MNVYAQPTDVNLRLCSLLSAVLNRSLRPDFVGAIQHKANVLMEESSGRLLDERPHLGLIFIGPPSKCTETLAARVPKFSREFELDIAIIPVRSSPKTPVTSILKTLQSLHKSTHFFTRTGRRVVIVAISSGVDVAGRFLSKMTTDEIGGILGVIAVDPPHHHFVPTNLLSFASIPVLVTLSWNEDQLLDKDRQLYLAHPNVILVQHNHKDIHGVDWEEKINTLESSHDPKSSYIVSLNQTYQLWMVRTIAKFSEAVAIIDPQRKQNVQRKDRSRMVLDTLMRPRLDHLASKL